MEGRHAESKPTEQERAGGSNSTSGHVLPASGSIERPLVPRAVMTASAMYTKFTTAGSDRGR